MMGGPGCRLTIGIVLATVAWSPIGGQELAVGQPVHHLDELAVRVVAIEVPQDAGDELVVRRAAPFQIDAWNEVEGDDPGPHAGRGVRAGGLPGRKAPRGGVVDPGPAA